MTYIQFIDGPAAHQTMKLARVPLLLRVVHSSIRGWGALDLLDDLPHQDEAIHVYRRSGNVSVAMIDRTDEHGRRVGERIQIVDYHLLPEQPGDESRTTAGWHAWCDRWAAAHQDDRLVRAAKMP